MKEKWKEDGASDSGSLVDVVVARFAKRLGLPLSREQLNTLAQFVKFGIVGVSNTIVAYVSYLASLLLTRKASLFIEYDLLIAQAISFLISVYWSFCWNNRFVFSSHSDSRNIMHALVKTYISYSFTGLFLSSALLIFWVDIVGLSEYFAPILNLVITVPLNFVLNKYWAFSGGSKKA